MRLPFAAGGLLAWAFGCGSPATSADAGAPSGPTVELSFVATSPYAGTLRVASASPSPRLLTLTPAAAGPFTVPPGEPVELPLVGLSAATTYRVQVRLPEDRAPAVDTFRFTTGAARVYRVLFDAAHGEESGSADWRIDDDDGAPQPATAQAEGDWKGSLSSWALLLVQSGRYAVQTLGESGTLSFGGSGAQDLSNFDVLVLPEPNGWGDLGTAPRDPAKGKAERAAVVAFVNAGGGLVMLADHAGSDRDNDGVDSPRVLAPLLAALATGIGFNSGKEYGQTSNFAPREPIVTGPFGTVSRLAMYAGTTFSVATASPSAARGVAFRDGLDPGSRLASLLAFAAAGAVGDGRVFLYGDSSAAGDGTGRRTDPTKDAWHAPGLSHPAFLGNATAWVAHEY